MSYGAFHARYVPCYSPRYGHLAIFPLKDFFFLQVMPMALFPESTGFVKLCQTSVAIMPGDNIAHHQLFELAIHAQALDQTFSSKKVEFCKLLGHMLKNVPTEDGPMEVMWMRVLRMLDGYKKSIDTAQIKGKFDRLWSPQSNPDLRKKLEAPFQINPPQVLDN